MLIEIQDLFRAARSGILSCEKKRKKKAPEGNCSTVDTNHGLPSINQSALVNESAGESEKRHAY